MRIKRVLRELIGVSSAVVIEDWTLDFGDDERPLLRVGVRARKRRRGGCGRCGARAPWYDRGDGRRRWRHIDIGFARCELVADAPRVDCAQCGPTVAALAWARHSARLTRAFEDLVVYDALASSKEAAAQRHGTTWRTVDGACVRVVEEALGRVDLLDGLVAISIDEVKYKKGQKYVTVVCDHVTGCVVWAHKGRSKATVAAFFDALGARRAAKLQVITADGGEWIHRVIAERDLDVLVCLDTYHVIGWATDALDSVRCDEWNQLRGANRADKAKAVKGMRWLLLRNWENLSGGQRGAIRDLEGANRRLFRAYRLKEELREIFTLPILQAQVALDEWLRYASRSKLAEFVKLARTIRHFRTEIEATIEWRFTNGLAESVNACIGRIRANARGFHSAQTFISMIMLDRAGIAPDLPWNHAS